ncbi:hypothetical protein A1O1_02743 [Capronia coronata CBS 617.96]|uniref:DUF1989 domain-containing protein n=1 Tax=Capronia coronata CBS 617.96 TaxID=1182541 RepID=W9ZIQ5_9EURO|nr:uncharacterized protein A1O1_02743 [Capronia coronata CBS 617.96]EXJ94349.1 hypothetical protein A1O1_02743 [Capronia coronata CBS 617.96]
MAETIPIPYHKYTHDTKHAIPARSSVAVPLQKSQTLTVINTHGTQVIDFWAFQTPEATLPKASTSKEQQGLTPLPIHHSTSHTRASTMHLSPLPNDVLVTNRRTPILKLIRDTTPGVHDTLIPACDRARYRQLGVPADTYHANCVDNLHSALETLGLRLPDAEGSAPPDPLNLFMNVPVGSGMGTGIGTGGAVVSSSPTPESDSTTTTNNNVTTAGAALTFEAPVCRKGDSVTFEALVDCVAVMSACPQDLVKVNNMEPTEAHFTVTVGEDSSS